MPLTDIQIKKLKPADKPQRVYDGGGLYLEVSPAGGKLWRYKYRFGGRYKVLSIGKYPHITLSEARDKHQEARKQLENGIDPSAAKKAAKLKRTNAFGVVAEEWYHNKRGGWSENYAKDTWNRLEKNVLPWLKDRPVDEISTAELLRILRKIEARGAVESAYRVGQICGQVFIYGIACGYLENNPANNLSRALKERKVKSMPAITEPGRITGLLRVIDNADGTLVVRSALQFIAYTFPRPGELRKAQWTEFDFEAAMWTIPADRMKMKRPHLIPLSRQAVEILKELEPLTGSGPYVFPSIRTNSRPMSENTLNVALRRLGYSKDEMVSHGFRTMASTNLHEMGWPTEVVEMQLSHIDRNAVRAAYNKALYLEERKRMMQAWADYLDELKSGAAIIPMKRGG
jgi:integrase